MKKSRERLPVLFVKQRCAASFAKLILIDFDCNFVCFFNHLLCNFCLCHKHSPLVNDSLFQQAFHVRKLTFTCFRVRCVLSSSRQVEAFV